jgi:hypothetical protein
MLSGNEVILGKSKLLRVLKESCELRPNESFAAVSLFCRDSFCLPLPSGKFYSPGVFPNLRRSVIAAVVLIGCAPVQGHEASNGPGGAAFEKMKTLVGTWEATVATGIQRAEFQLIANGSVIMNRLSGGMPHDMHTMLHMDGSEFMLTHYCAMRNQPRMVLAPGSDPNRLVFEFRDGRNIKPGDVYMSRVAFIIDGPNHHIEEWTHLAKGEEKTTSAEFRRKQ